MARGTGCSRQICTRSCEVHFQVEMELEGSSIPDGSEMAEDDLPVLEKKMKQMMKFKEHLFKDAKANIDQAQSRYKQDYDRKRSASEVFVDCIHNFTQMLM